jgi:hypothetical protein
LFVCLFVCFFVFLFGWLVGWLFGWQPALLNGWKTLHMGDLVHARVHALEPMPPTGSGDRYVADAHAHVPTILID